MPSAAYFRRQADICLRLSLIASDDTVSNRLITMARDYMATSEAMDKEKGAGPPATADQSASPDADVDRDPPELGSTPELPGSGAES
jgi:hypothetical protein